MNPFFKPPYRQKQQEPRLLSWTSIALVILLPLLIGFGAGYWLRPTVEEARLPPEEHVYIPPEMPPEEPIAEIPALPPPPPPEPSAEPAWQRYAVKVNIDPKSPKIALLIDDMGVDLKHSREILDLPAPLTLAYLPYSHGLTRQSTQAHIRGHELMLHLPMQPLSADEYPGPRALLVSQSDEEIRQNLLFNLDRLSGYTGVNNHMGSRFTADARRMRLVLEILKQRGLFFLDSRTNGKSQAEKVAAELGMPHLGRDVFVDDDDTPEAIARQLRTMEKIAKKHGQVIGIAHPRRATVSALREWIPKMQAQGFAFVPISYIVARKERVAPSRPEITGAGVPDIPAR